MEDLLKAARKGKTEEVEVGWMEALEQEDVPWKKLIEVGQALCRVEEQDTAESLFWFLVSSLSDAGKEKAALTVAREGLKGIPDSDDLREEAIRLYREEEEDEEWARAVLKLTLGDYDLGGARSVERMEKLEDMAPGSYVRVDPGARIGMVVGLDPREGFEIDFEGRRGTFDLDELDRLEGVSDDDVRALVVYEKDRLADMAENTPLELIRLVLNTFEGRMNLKRVRRYIKPCLRDKKWSGWWSSTRKKLEKSATIGSTGGRSPDLFIRSEPMDRAEQLKRRFDRARAFEKLEEVDEILGETSSELEGRLELLQHIGESLMGMVERAGDGGKQVLKMGALAALDNVRESDPDALPADMSLEDKLLNREQAEDVLKGGDMPEDILEDVLQKLPDWYSEDWPELFASIMPHLPSVGCSWCARQLAAAGEESRAEEVAEEILHIPNPHPGAVIWLWKVVNDVESISIGDDVARLSVLRKLLSVLALASRGGAMSEEDQKKLTSRVRDALLSAGENAIEECVSGASDEEISALMAQVERCQGLTKRVRARVARSIRAARPELFRASVPPWEQNVIYTTEEGYQKRSDEYDHIVNERMPEVIQEVGEAAEFGDLSENAEYTAAMEERGRLSEEASQIKDELSRSRIITHEMADSSTVTVGSRVTVRDVEDNEERILTFLGPWDADPSSDVYSYEAPLSKKFMGKAVGDEVEARRSGEMRTYEIKKIEPGV